MNRIISIISGLSLLGSLALVAAPAKPNIIIILTDDHGYTDLGIHGIDANVQTPAMDTVVAGGALSRPHFSNLRSNESRASFKAWRSQWRLCQHAARGC